MAPSALMRRMTTIAASIIGCKKLIAPCAAFSLRKPSSMPSALTQQTIILGRRISHARNGADSFNFVSRLFASSVDKSTVVDAENIPSVLSEDDVGDGLVNSYTYDSEGDDDCDEDSDDDVDLSLDDEENEEDTDAHTSDDPTYVFYKALLMSVQSSLANISKKATSLQRELEKAQSLEETQKRANLIVSNLYRLPPGTTSAQVEDWENGGKVVDLVLNTKDYGSAQEESDALFAMARKMKRGSKVVEKLMKEVVEAEEILNDALQDLLSLAGNGENNAMMNAVDISSLDLSNIPFDENIRLDEGAMALIQDRLERSSKKTGFQSPDMDEIINEGNTSNQRQKPNNRPNNTANSRDKRNRSRPNPRELISPSGHKVLVGRNRRDNEAICFQLSRPNDIWMHSRGCPGAHVLLCVRRGSPEVTEDDLQFAADLAVFYSDARTERRAEVTTAEPKHITKPRGAPPGAVTLRQEGKTLVGRPENVPDELKEAREQSGGAWDEMGYRKLGTRAKNKKRTASVEKERKEKWRKAAREKNKRRKQNQDEKGISGFD
ncbi:hypothetical protein ACHAXS_008908 [Conticribra weissflogii]